MEDAVMSVKSRLEGGGKIDTIDRMNSLFNNMQEHPTGN